MKMNDGDSVTFMERFGEYSRIALDKEAQSIEIRERDNAGHDTSLGAFTLGMDRYLDQQRWSGSPTGYFL